MWCLVQCCVTSNTQDKHQPRHGNPVLCHKIDFNPETIRQICHSHPIRHNCNSAGTALLSFPTRQKGFYKLSYLNTSIYGPDRIHLLHYQEVSQFSHMFLKYSHSNLDHQSSHHYLFIISPLSPVLFQPIPLDTALPH